MTDWKSSLRSNPIPWLLDTAAAPIRYRVLTELLDLGRDDPDVQKVRQEMLLYPPSIGMSPGRVNENLMAIADAFNGAGGTR